MKKFIKYFIVFMIGVSVIGCADLESDYPLTKIGDKQTFVDKGLIGYWIMDAGDDAKGHNVIEVIYNKKEKRLEQVVDKYYNNEPIITSKINGKTYLSKKKMGKKVWLLYRYKLNKDEVTIFYYDKDTNNNKKVNNKKEAIRLLNNFVAKQVYLRKKNYVKPSHKKKNLTWIKKSKIIQECKKLNPYLRYIANGECYTHDSSVRKLCRNLGGKVPNKDELESVISDCGGKVTYERFGESPEKNMKNLSYRKCYESKGFSSNYPYWAIDNLGGPNDSWAISLYDGLIKKDNELKSQNKVCCIDTDKAKN